MNWPIVVSCIAILAAILTGYQNRRMISLTLFATLSPHCRLGFRTESTSPVYHEDEQPMGGRMRLMVFDTSTGTVGEALAEYNSQAKESYEREIGGKLAQIIHYYKLRIKQRDVTTPVNVVVVEQPVPPSSERESGAILATPESLRVFRGYKYINGEIYVPRLNT